MAKERYSKVTRRMWTDRDFRALPGPPPNPQSLWQWLLTCPEQSNVPGLIRIGVAGIAEALGWPVDGAREALGQLLELGWIEMDEISRLVWIPNRIKHDPPASPNVVISWGENWAELPECALRDRAHLALWRWCAARGRASWRKAFEKACGKPPDAPDRGSRTGSTKEPQKAQQKSTFKAFAEPSDKATGKPSATPCPKGFEKGSERGSDAPETTGEEAAYEGQKPPQPQVLKPFAKASPKPSPNPSPNQEQDQEDLCESTRARARDAVRASDIRRHLDQHSHIDTWEPVAQVLAACDRVWGISTHIRDSRSDPRVMVVLDRLSEGFSPDELERALTGSRKSEYIASHPQFQTVTTLLKDADAVDKYGRLATEPRVRDNRPAGGGPRSGRPVPKQPKDESYYRNSGWVEKKADPLMLPDDEASGV